jgi:hypothetical protein
MKETRKKKNSPILMMMMMMSWLCVCVWEKWFRVRCKVDDLLRREKKLDSFACVDEECVFAFAEI